MKKAEFTNLRIAGRVEVTKIRKKQIPATPVASRLLASSCNFEAVTSTMVEAILEALREENPNFRKFFARRIYNKAGAEVKLLTVESGNRRKVELRNIMDICAPFFGKGVASVDEFFKKHCVLSIEGRRRNRREKLKHNGAVLLGELWK